MKKILIAEDDQNINNLLRDLLTHNGYQPIQTFSGTEAVMALESKPVDLILLDLMLPGKTGGDVLEEIRTRLRLATPVIAITAVSDKDSVVGMLKSGADDYITKPFDNAELLARIEARLRNSSASESGEHNRLQYRELTLDSQKFDGFIGGNALALSKKEYEILKLLMEYPQKVFTKNNLYESVWDSEFLGDDNTLNVHISKIRSKIAKFAEGEYIQTVWGIGFKMG